jgi:hypothetical protein
MDQAKDDRCPTPMALLRSRVPLSLLLDLTYGPDSRHVLATEPAGRPVLGTAAPIPGPRASRTPAATPR